MKYMLQIYGNVTRDQVAAMSEEEQRQLWADWGAISQTPGVTPAPFELDDPTSATTIRVENGQTLVTDGPFAQTKEALGGWMLYEADDLDAHGAVAIAEADGLEAGLAAMDTLDGLDGYHYFHAAQADVLRRLGRSDEARAAYERALELVRADAERRFLERRLAAL